MVKWESSPESLLVIINVLVGSLLSLLSLDLGLSLNRYLNVNGGISQFDSLDCRKYYMTPPNRQIRLRRSLGRLNELILREIYRKMRPKLAIMQECECQ